MDLQDCGMDKNVFFCRPILFYVLYVIFIDDKLLSNAVYIVRNRVARPTSLRIGKIEARQSAILQI